MSKGILKPGLFKSGKSATIGGKPEADGEALAGPAGAQGADRRRFPRVFFKQAGPQGDPIRGAVAQWPSGEKTGVLDISYMGAALSAPAKMSPQAGDKVELAFEFAGASAVPISGEVVRAANGAVAVSFERGLTTDARLALDKFLHARLIGAHMRPIDPKWFARPGSSTHWFHGPNNSNAFLWYDAGRMDRAVLELGARFLEWRGGKFYEGDARPFIDYEGEDGPALFSVADADEGTLGAHHATARLVEGFTPFMIAALDALSHAQDPERALDPLIEAMKERSK